MTGRARRQQRKRARRCAARNVLRLDFETTPYGHVARFRGRRAVTVRGALITRDAWHIFEHPVFPKPGALFTRRVPR